MADNDIHVLPVNDIREHIESVDCPCNPRVEVVGAGLVIIHNAWDFREVYEWLDEGGDICQLEQE